MAKNQDKNTTVLCNIVNDTYIETSDADAVCH